MTRFEWHRWSEGDDPCKDPEWTFDDLMISHKGEGFGCLTWVVGNIKESKRLQKCVDQFLNKLCITHPNDKGG